MIKFVCGLRFILLAVALLLSTWPALAQPGPAGSINKFDGTWSVTSTGCSKSPNQSVFMISSGKFIGEGLSGGVSPSGASNSVWTNGQITSNGSGRFSGGKGSGTFHRTDGCSGRWMASKM
jgi:hypothetical protein